MNKNQYESIIAWQDKIFTKATALSCVNHLQEEVEELKADIENGEIGCEEIADCFLLLFGLCNKSGLSYEQVVDIIAMKMLVNYHREWAESDEKGYVKHVEEPKGIAKTPLNS